MKFPSFFAAVVLFLLAASPSSGALPKPITDWEGSVTAITESSITVQNPKGTRIFTIYPGTVFGKGGRKKLGDFKVGDIVHVVFGEQMGKARAENIRHPSEDKKPAPKPAKKK
jgi:hypothetical protein